MQHYLSHVPLIIGKLGPLRAYSTRFLERTIGKFGRLINAKRQCGINASNVVERIAVHNLVSTVVNVEEEIDLIVPRPYTEDTYFNNPDEPNGPQLWVPFTETVSNLSAAGPNETLESVPSTKILNALNRYYVRDRNVSNLHNSSIQVAGRLWKDSNIIASAMYRRINRETSRGNHYVMFKGFYRT